MNACYEASNSQKRVMIMIMGKKGKKIGKIAAATSAVAIIFGGAAALFNKGQPPGVQPVLDDIVEHPSHWYAGKSQMISKSPSKAPPGQPYVFNFIRFDPPSGNAANADAQTCFIYTLSLGPENQHAAPEETPARHYCRPKVKNKNPQMPTLSDG